MDFWPFLNKRDTKLLSDWFGMIHIGSDTDIRMNWNSSDCLGMNFNPILSLGFVTHYDNFRTLMKVHSVLFYDTLWSKTSKKIRDRTEFKSCLYCYLVFFGVYLIYSESFRKYIHGHFIHIGTLRKKVWLNLIILLIP